MWTASSLLWEGLLLSKGGFQQVTDTKESVLKCHLYQFIHETNEDKQSMNKEEAWCLH